MSVQITYEYYDGSTKRKPPMSPVLEGYITKIADHLALKIGLTHMHIVHVGTVGDANHAPKSYHCTKPPRAIDVLKIYLTRDNWARFMLDMRDLKQRATVADFWSSFGGKYAHKSDPKHQHIHLQTQARTGEK